MCAICDAHKKKLDVEQLYNPGEDRKSGCWRSDELEIRCGRENQHPAEGAFRNPDCAVAVGEKILKWGIYPREAVVPGLRLSCTGERERNTVMAIRVGVNMLQSLFGLQLSLTHNPFNKVRGMFF